MVIRSTVPPGTVEELVRPTLARFAPDGCAYGVAMVPEFLREGSGVSDFFAPPFTVIGTDDALVGNDVAELFSGFDARVHIVATRTAEALKYACNAFHATKVSFANEIARLFRGMGIDSRVVMELFCEDDQLNISPSYLRPGFAFGGSCLPKDLRALLYLARVNSVDLPMLSATLESNEITISDVVDRIIAHGGRNIAVLGLSFKMETDDLRESPNVILCETLLGKGYNIRIYDPIVKPARLIGANQSYVESKLAHLQRLLTDSVGDALAGADVAIVSSRDPSVVAALVATPPPLVIDISGRLGPRGRESARLLGDWLVKLVLRRRSARARPRVLIIVQNLPVPFDRRVWLECQALTDAGYEVHVVCPKGPGDPTFEVVDGIALHKYRPSPGRFGHAWVSRRVLVVAAHDDVADRPRFSTRAVRRNPNL